MNIIEVLSVLFILGSGCGASLGITIQPPMKVLVTGASGKTGRLVFEALLEQQQQQEQGARKYDARALVRSEKSAKSLLKTVPQTGLAHVLICDVTKLSSDDAAPLGLEGCEAMIICTSAMPVINKMSLIKAFLKAPINLVRGKKMIDFRSFQFEWKGGQHPEKVDYEGQKAQIDLAKKLGMKRVVVVGSMGGTDPNNFLNRIGKNPDGSGHGDILLWKRKAEKYLVESGLDYTIIHPGGLTDNPAGEKELVLDVDDKLLKREQRSISRADVANLAIAGLNLPKGKKVAFDAISQPTTTTSPPKTAEQALKAFLAEKKMYSYAE